MNLVLIDSEEVCVFPAGTPKAAHLSRVLKVGVGSTFWCGVKNGLRGLATVREISACGDIAFDVKWDRAVQPELPPVRLLVGLARPQTMKKVFGIASEIGCARIDVFRSELGDPAYAESSLWRDGDKTLDEILEKSAEQTCVPVLPQYRLHASLEKFLESEACVSEQRLRCIALDIYGEPKALSATEFSSEENVLLAIGPERGWSDTERNLLRERGFEVAHIGERILRVETAVSVALSVALAKTGAWRPHIPLENR